jgi:hypothetical protein
MVGTKSPRRRMVDEELVLRFFALSAGLGTYRTPLKRFLNDFMAASRNAEPVEIGRLRTKFTETTAVVNRLLGQAAFRITDTTGRSIEPAVNRALFDAQMLACSWIAEDVGEIDIVRVRRSLAGLFGDELFMDAIQRATGDRARTLKRIRETVSALQSGGVRLQLPFDLSR